MTKETKETLESFLELLTWRRGRKAGMGANLYYTGILLFVLCIVLAVSGHPVPDKQTVTFEGLLILIGLASGLVGGGTYLDKKHEQKMKLLDNQAAAIAKEPDAPAPPAA